MGRISKPNENTRRLREASACASSWGTRAENVTGADVVVYSSAIDPQNPEIARARALEMPIIPRAEMLAELMRMRYAVTIAGSHGKTTTTSLVATVLRAAGLDPTVVVGGQGQRARLERAPRRGRPLRRRGRRERRLASWLTPTIAVVTNIDAEHLDHYGTHDAVKDAFVQHVNKVPFYGLCVLCLDHPSVQEILPRIERRHVTYGISRQADYRAKNPRFEGLATHFDAYRRNESLGELRRPHARRAQRAQRPGRHRRGRRARGAARRHARRDRRASTACSGGSPCWASPTTPRRAAAAT